MAEGTSDMVEVPSDQEDSGSDLDDNFQSTSMEQTTQSHSSLILPLSYLCLIG